MKMIERHQKLLKSGMFWEFYPQLSGEWEKDKKEFTRLEKYYDKHFRNKEKDEYKSKNFE
jgi:hypothetical protein